MRAAGASLCPDWSKSAHLWQRLKKTVSGLRQLTGVTRSVKHENVAGFASSAPSVAVLARGFGTQFARAFPIRHGQPCGNREYKEMSKRKRDGELRNTSGERNGGDVQEVWHKEEQSRHKWFRKRKKGDASRRSRFDDEIDEEDDEEYGEIGIALRERHADVPEADQTAGEEVMARAARDDVWGMASAIDIYDCDPNLIRDADAIRYFVAELCDLIEMKRFGETQVVHFGEDERVAGYSMVQLIETSLISAHFANQTNAVYLDVFSCKPYNSQTVREFSQAFFKGRKSTLQVALRR